MVYDRFIEGARAFERDGRAFLNCDYELTANPRDACDCDILVTTTPVRLPIVKEAWIKPGTHINAIGADAKGKQELETSLTKRAKIVVDDAAQAIHSGEVNVPISEGDLRPEEIYSQIGGIVAGKVRGRTSKDEITIFDSTGLAIQDVATGRMVYEKALESSKGSRLKLM
jgi:alanine dehydrogenase